LVRNLKLDVLRGVAVLLVFCRHSQGALLLCHFGWVGVDLFFVLSGFLVSSLLFREYQQTQAIRPITFLLRRGFKIYPQFYLLLCITLGVTLWTRSSVDSSQLLAETFFFQNYSPGLWAHTWSLAVEEHFYILLSIAIWYLARSGGGNPFSRIPRFIAITSAAIIAMRIVTFLLHPDKLDYVHIFPSHLRMDSLLAGVLLGYYNAFKRSKLAGIVQRYRHWLSPVSILLLSPVAFLDQNHPFIYTFGFSLVALAFAILLLTVLTSVSFSRPTLLSRLGRVSYAFYLWHGPILFADDRMLAKAGITMSVWVNLPITFAAIVGIAFLTTWFVEIPFLRLRDKVFPSALKSVLVEPRPLTQLVEVGK
jgi:peptidoglycan/LPS O-acetylase OafA/YrhL